MNKPVQNGSYLTGNSIAETIIDSSAVMFLLLNQEGRIARFNRACEIVSGYRAEEVLGTFPWETLLPCEDAERIKQEAFEVLAVHPHNLKTRYINYWQRKNGERRLIEWNNTALHDEAGNIEFIVSVGTDITERHHAEQELQTYRENLESLVAERSARLHQESLKNETIISTAMDGFFVTNMRGKLLDCNQSYCDMLGYTFDEMINLSVPDLEAVETHEETAQHIQYLIEHGSDRFDTRHRHKDGHLIDVEMNVTLAEVDNERLFFAFAHDISQRKRNEAELIQARLEAERANAAKSEFLSRMSHELRTPLNAILGFAQLLESDTGEKLSDPQSSSVNEILQAGHHLLDMVNEILDLSRIESGKMSIDLQTVDISPTIRNCVTQLQPMIQDRNISLNNNANESCIVKADPIRLKQILFNLLSNAVKYNHDGGHVDITCKQNKKYIRVSIQDTGPGIPDESLPHLFKPFERLGPSDIFIEGTGIGLALAKNLVELMHGQIGVDSTPGKGSTFWFDLPVAIKQRSEKPVPEKENNPAEYTNEEKKYVLYIEDNLSNLKLMQKIIALCANLELLSAETAAEGLSIAAEQRPDLIFLDINLPDMNGFETLDKLQNMQDTRDIPVIAVTANAQPRDIERARTAGFADYITKPFDIRQLMASLDQCLGPDDDTA